jgi:hypothetical protein
MPLSYQHSIILLDGFEPLTPDSRVFFRAQLGSEAPQLSLPLLSTFPAFADQNMEQSVRSSWRLLVVLMTILLGPASSTPVLGRQTYWRLVDVECA